MGTHPIFESDFDCLTELMYLSVRLSRGRSPFLQKKLYEIARSTHLLKNGKPWEEVKEYRSGVPQISFNNIVVENSAAREELQRFELQCFARETNYWTLKHAGKTTTEDDLAFDKWNVEKNKKLFVLQSRVCNPNVFRDPFKWLLTKLLLFSY